MLQVVNGAAQEFTPPFPGSGLIKARVYQDGPVLIFDQPDKIIHGGSSPLWGTTDEIFSGVAVDTCVSEGVYLVFWQQGSILLFGQSGCRYFCQLGEQIAQKSRRVFQHGEMTQIRHVYDPGALDALSHLSDIGGAG